LNKTSVLKIILLTVSAVLPQEFEFYFNTDNFNSASISGEI